MISTSDYFVGAVQIRTRNNSLFGHFSRRGSVLGMNLTVPVKKGTKTGLFELTSYLKRYFCLMSRLLSTIMEFSPKFSLSLYFTCFTCGTTVNEKSISNLSLFLLDFSILTNLLTHSNITSL